MPERKVRLDAFYDPTPGVPGKFVTLEGGFLLDVDQFDAGFFEVSPREATLMDPQQRLLMEVAWEAFEDAGIVPAHLAGTKTGVFVGMWTNEYEDYLYNATADVDLHMTTGGNRHSASGRLSYTFDLRGPNLTLDTACSSSLVAIHLACNSLRSGESETALAAGANLILQPHISIGYSRSRMLSPRGRCRFGDATADGYVRSEGVGVLVLKPLGRALASGDNIHGVILGSAVNNDGRGSGLLVAPSTVGQEAMLRAAYESASVSPGDVQYIEAHGTGTKVGDPVELEALSTVLSKDRPADRRCLVGSLKTNIGHTEATAGIAGVIKTVLAMKHGLVPASLHLLEPNPAIPWATMPLVVARQQQSWPAVEKRLAGVSSFGLTGTNAHVVLGQAPDVALPRHTATGPFLLPISAHTPEALVQLSREYVDQFRRDGDQSLPDVCYTASLRRTHHEHRATIVVRSLDEAADQLEAFGLGESRTGLSSGRVQRGATHKVAFVFPGQGSQWLGMGRALLVHEPAFAAAMAECDGAISSVTGWSAIAELQADVSASRLSQIDVVQPVLFSIQVALAALWRSWGVEPAAVIGHSMGEVAAAYVAGALSLEDAARIICRRSALLKRTSGKGSMAVVELSFAEASAALAGNEARLSVAVSNSSRSTVISGDPASLEELIATLEARDVFCRRVKVDVASHSPQMDPLKADLLDALRDVTPRPAELVFCSTVFAEPIETTQLVPAYWVQNLRAPVLFAQAVGRLVADGYDTFVEISPHPLLVSAIQETATEARSTVVALPSLRRDEDEQVALLASAGALHCQGRSLAWDVLARAGTVVELPAFPWQRESYWFEPEFARPSQPGRDALLGRPLRPSLQSNVVYFEFDLSVERLPYLADHRVRGSVVVPAAFFIAIASEGTRRLHQAVRSQFESLTFTNALVLREGQSRSVQLVMSDEADGRSVFRFLSQENGGSDSAAPWVEHVSGKISVASAASDRQDESLETILARCEHELEPGVHFAAMSRRGLEYGPAFRTVSQSRCASSERVVRLAAPSLESADPEKLRSLVTLLDGCLQAVMATVDVGDAGDTFVPVAVDRLNIHRSLEGDTNLWVHVLPGTAATGNDRFQADVDVFDGNGVLTASATGVRMQRIERELDRLARAAMHHLEWQPSPIEAARGRRGTWLLLGEDGPVERGLFERLKASSQRVVLVTAGTSYGTRGPTLLEMNPTSEADAAQLLASEPSCAGVVDLRSLSAQSRFPATEVTQAAAAATIAKTLASMNLQEPPRLWLVTAGTQPVGGAVLRLNGSALWGLRSVIASESPKLRCSACDLPGVVDEESLDALTAELLASAGDDEVALRGRDRFVRQLRRGLAEETTRRQSRPAAGQPYRASTDSPGMLDALRLEAARRTTPQSHEVEIEVQATGLNFMNVMSALGVCPGYSRGLGPLGIECTGFVSRVGSAVTDVSAGDRVMAFAHDSLATHAVAPASLVRRIPDGLGFVEAATIPIAFLTAYYALVHLGRIASGERVLIHAAAGGVGLAALQIAQAAGAEIYATAGSDEKRALLRSMGVVHVSDSRSLSFVDDIRAATGGAGVDLVLNSLAGEAIAAGLSLLRSGGRFLEIGKRDIYENRSIGLLPFQRNLSYHAIDLDRMSRETPAALGHLFDRIVAGFADGTFRPLPTERFPIARLNDAFRRMAQGAHTGKIVLEIDRDDVPIDTRRSSVPSSWGEGTVLITGGTGALGLAVASWMVEQGARHLALVSRHGEGASITSVAALRARGADVRVLAGDVARSEDVYQIIGQIDANMPPLRGVVHAAGLLDDATIDQVTLAQFERVAAPKISGAWNLHEATRKHSLDFFVLFSSVAAFIGSPGQANYASSNAVLDSLAYYRRGAGLHAISIAWGPWSQVGLAAERAERGARLENLGLGSLTPELGVALFAEILRIDPSHAAAMSFDVARWSEAYPAAGRRTLFTNLLRESSLDADVGERQTTTGIREALAEVPPGRRRRKLLEEFVRQQVGLVLRMSPARVDVQKPFRTMGLDSLMGLELRNRLETGTGASLPATSVWNYPTVSLLASEVAVRLGVALDGAQDSAPMESVVTETLPGGGDADIETLLNEMEGLSDEDARRLLAEER
jgi:acyl transferase domain-containing protein/NAD(P)-dependent dehydrogenase (short-subunit alcohol dehydrogenase family)